MSFSKIIKELQKLPPDTPVGITLQTTKRALMEMNLVSGTWEGKRYSFEVNTCWRCGEIACDDMDLEELIEMLGKRKRLDRISSGDFPSLTLNSTSDGDPEYEEIEWEEELTEEELEGAPPAHELYWEGDIDECDYSFLPGGLWSMEITCGPYSVTVEDE